MLFNHNLNFDFNDIIINTNYEGRNNSEIIDFIKSVIKINFSMELINTVKNYYAF